MKMSHEKLILLKYTPRLWESLQKPHHKHKVLMKMNQSSKCSNCLQSTFPYVHNVHSLSYVHNHQTILTCTQCSHYQTMVQKERMCKRLQLLFRSNHPLFRYNIHFVGKIQHYGGQIESFVERKMLGLNETNLQLSHYCLLALLTCVRLKL